MRRTHRGSGSRLLRSRRPRLPASAIMADGVAPATDRAHPMPKQIRLNAFDMNCVGHQSPGLWTHPRDRADRYNTLEYWVELAKLLERGKFDALFLADVLGVYDVYRGSADRERGTGAGERSTAA